MTHITRISRRHLPEILHLIVGLREDARREVDPQRVAERFHALMGRRDGGLHVLVAKDGRFPVGYLAGCFITNTTQMTPEFCILEVYIAKPYRGGATLRALGAEAVRYAASKGAEGLELRLRCTQRELVLLAEAWGFEPTGREVFERAIEP